MSQSAKLIIIIVLLIFMSAFFSSAETAFSSLNKVKLKAMTQNGKKNKRIEQTLALSADYDVVLSTILIGNNLVNIACTSIATLVFTGFFGADLGATLSTIIMTIVVLIFGEVTPKTIAKEKAEKIALAFSPIIKFFTILFYPVNLFFRGWKLLLNKAFGLGNVDTVTEEELKTYVDEAHTGGEIDENESELIRSSIEFDDIEVGDILTPRVDVEAVDKYMPLSDIEKIFSSSNYSRLPVYIGDIDHIVGVIHHRDFQSARQRNLKSLRTILKPVPTVSPDTKISKLLRIIQKSKTHLAVVVDEFGGTEGIVTLEDILEELVGEIWDEHDEVSLDFEKVKENIYIVDSTAAIDRFFEFFSIPKDDDVDYSTVNGWIMESIDKIPEVNDHFTRDGLNVLVLSAQGKRADKIQITIMENENVSKENETI